MDETVQVDTGQHSPSLVEGKDDSDQDLAKPPASQIHGANVEDKNDTRLVKVCGYGIIDMGSGAYLLVIKSG